MKKLTKLNGSDITANERETSERRFIRYYSQLENKPQRWIMPRTFCFPIWNKFFFRYLELTEKHGNLKPLVDITIRAPYLIGVRLVYNQMTHDKEIDVRQTVQQFKKYLVRLFFNNNGKKIYLRINSMYTIITLKCPDHWLE